MIKNIFKIEPSFARLSDVDFNSCKKLSSSYTPVARPDSPDLQLYDLIFAPNSHGWPSSDLSINAETLRDPSVQQFVSDRLRNVHQPVGNVVDVDDDSITDSVKSQFESNEAYVQRRVKAVQDIKDSIDKPKDD